MRKAPLTHNFHTRLFNKKAFTSTQATSQQVTSAACYPALLQLDRLLLRVPAPRTLSLSGRRAEKASSASYTGIPR